MKIFYGLLVFLASLSLVSPSFAAGCYSQSEAEAEQGIRIHSELMVIGLNCQQIGKRFNMNLYGQYRAFTARHGDLFAKYEEVLMANFKKNGDPAPEKSLNTLRTRFANKISNDAADIRPDIFCARYAPRITKASTMTTEDVRKWAATIYPSHPVSRPVCAAAKAK